jgi:predicted nucleic acid-binding protein
VSQPRTRMVGSKRTFVDTNILAYAHDAADPEKHARATAFLLGIWADQAGVVSTQVLGELYSVLTRKMVIAPADAREIVLLYAAWPVIETDVPMLAAAMERHERDQVAWWDALIVEAAIRAGATRLATEDLQAGRTFDGSLEVVNPLV